MVSMKTSFLKDIFRSIWQSRARFLSILGMVALGVGFFAGINATKPDMLISADRYYQDQRLADYRLLSPLGFREQEITELKQLPGLAELSEAHIIDLFLTTPDGLESTVRLYSNDNSSSSGNGLNLLTLLDGRLPEKPGEIAIEKGMNLSSNIPLGTVLTASVPEDQQLSDYVESSAFTVVGYVRSPLYIDFQRGQTNIGGGSIHWYAFADEAEFSAERPGNIFLRFRESDAQAAYSEAYKERIAAMSPTLETMGENAIAAEVSELRAEIETGRNELLDEKETAARELASAEQKLKDAEQAIADGEAELQANEKKYRRELADQRTKLEKGRAELAAGRELYEASLAEWNEGFKAWSEGDEQLQASKARLDAIEAELAAGERELEAARINIEAGQTELAKSEAELVAAKAQLDISAQEIAARETQLTEADAALKETANQLTATAAGLEAMKAALDPAKPAEYVQGLAAYETGLAQLNAGRVQYEKAVAELVGGRQALEAGKIAYNQGLAAYETGKAKFETGKAEFAGRLAAYEAAVKRMADGWRQFNLGMIEYESGRAELEAAKAVLDNGKAELDRAQAEITANQKLLADGAAALARGERELERALEDGRLKLVKARAELNDGLAAFGYEKAEAERLIASAEADIHDAERALIEIPDSWFVFTRDSFPGYSGYSDDAERIGAVAKVFPLFFFLIAALVCLTTMTRMVEEERVQIGTLKALGYGSLTVSLKYLLYALLACAAGTVVGLALGFWLFPTVIMAAYNLMYEIPYRLTPPHADLSLISGLFAVVTILSATLTATLGELKATPAVLMQIKAPKPGKRILLERFQPLWRRLSFSNKVTARNIFRYKQRFLMTIIGIAGCTALLLTGFGLKDSISAIGTKQFAEIFVYDGTVYYDNEKPETSSELPAKLAAEPEVKSSLQIFSETITLRPAGSGREFEASLVVPANASESGQYYNLRERVSGIELQLPDDGAILTEKLADLLNVKVGDIVSWTDSDQLTYKTLVAGVAENYLAHYIYMSPAYYDQITYQSPQYNSIAFNLNDPQAADEDSLAADLLATEGVLGVVFTAGISDQFGDVLGSLNTVVLVLIVSAGALAFIVLYNLTNINITERAREIATLKVLGFRDKEVSAYVYRENIVLAAIGTLVGLVTGYFLHGFVMNTMEIDSMMFGKQILPLSYVWSIVLTMAFAFLVNAFMYYRLIRIDMVESLKAGE